MRIVTSNHVSELMVAFHLLSTCWSLEMPKCRELLQERCKLLHLKMTVGVIGNLVHSSPNIKREVLLAGALQPVIKLLSSSCPESQREATLLLGQFAVADFDSKVHIV